MAVDRARAVALNRRHFVFGGLAATAAASTFAPGSALGAVAGGERKLRLHNIHTGEVLKSVYWQDGDYVGGALEEINYILRDWRREEVYDMDVGTLDLLSDLHRRMESSEPFHIISGYRSPKTNGALRDKSNGVAKRSLHMRGMAIDLCLPGRDLKKLHAAAVSMKRGGVGLYAKSGFIHVDTGRVRYW